MSAAPSETVPKGLAEQAGASRIVKTGHVCYELIIIIESLLDLFLSLNDNLRGRGIQGSQRSEVDSHQPWQVSLQ